MDDTGSGASTRARCAVHADRDASKTCARCGNFGCEACFADAAGARFERCASCREREGVGQIPWERPGGVLRRYSATIEAAIRAPSATFGALGGGELKGALTFAVISCGLGVAPVTLLASLAVLGFAVWRSDPVGVVGVLLWVVLPVVTSLVSFLLAGAVFHGAARLLGGRASLRESLRAALYSSAWEPFTAIASPFYCVPFLGALIVIGLSGVSAVWRTRALGALAERAHGLSRGGALTAAALGAATLFVVWLAPITFFTYAIVERMILER